MIKSMTGFGRAELHDAEKKITVEVKSVNHRYLDFNIRMPKKFSPFEASIRTVMKEYAQRGKVDIFIGYEDYTQSHLVLKYNSELAGQYLAGFRKMEEEFGIPNPITAETLGRCPEVFSMEDQPQDEEELWKDLETVIRQAATQFAEARQTEGQALREDLLEKLEGMKQNVAAVEERAPMILEEYKARLLEKTRELLEDAKMEESRILAEVVLFADKICTDEETVRLNSHIDNMANVLKKGGPIGRKLDFIAQEMNRESNTILSKSNDLQTSEIAIELKTEVEKIREQVQNIE